MSGAHRADRGRRAPQIKRRARANFDVAVLFYNRATQTANCILSFLNEEIQPNIVILDQGSASGQRQQLEDALGNHPNIRFLGFAKNIGIAAGRNMLCRECSSDWVMFTDNDIVLNTRGGVALIECAIANVQDRDGFVPRVLNVHENRFVERLQISNRNGLKIVAPAEPDIGVTDAFPGGAVILRRSVLLRTPYDESHFVGFEDFDVALRMSKNGCPLRIATLDTVTLAHKHTPAVSEPDMVSVRTRYSSSLVAESYKHFAAKHEGKALAEWEPWLADQRRDMIPSSRIVTRAPRDKVDISFVIDVPDWAFDNLAGNLQLHIGERHNLNVVYAQTIDSAGEVLRQILTLEPRIIHFMWRADCHRLFCAAAVNKCAKLMGVSTAEIIDQLCQSHITFSVCDHLFLGPDDLRSLRPFFWLADAYSVNSHILLNTYDALSDYPKATALLMNGVNTALYHPDPLAKKNRDVVKIGWVGNSDWGDSEGLADVKGLRTIIRPAIEALQVEGFEVELLALDRAERWRKRDEVAALYREMDVYVCASSMEGTPNTVLEAMASGLPVVATRVGNVPYLFGQRQHDFIVERSVEAFVGALRKLCSDPKLREQLAQENIEQIRTHTWESRAPLWRQFFEDVIRRAHPEAATWKRFIIERFYFGDGPSDTALPQFQDRSLMAKGLGFIRSARN
jgi:glycosyltransferase involved in cell wall biosynthesis